MKSRHFLIFTCMIGALQLFGCADETGGAAFQPVGEGSCGNGKWNVGEECDDGNTEDGDGCSATCAVEFGYQWTENGIEEVPPAPNCGNKKVEIGEACDDGNNESGDGCTSNCLNIEPGYKCKKPGEPCVRIEVENKCGNGEIDSGEACDDGNDYSDDGCYQCKVEDGWTCDEDGCTQQSAGTPVCGNKIVEGDEQCDDGNKVDDDCCSASCRVNIGCACSNGGTNCYPITNTYVCGDGSVDPGEECDDENDYSDDGCYECKIEDGWRCNNEQGSASFCTQKRCGDNIIDKDRGEVCDDGNNNVDYHPDEGHCTTSCQLAPYCGDGHLDAGEACDDGALNGTSASPNSCSKKCSIDPHCGDGRVDAEELGEVCDEGEDNGDICAADCKSVKKGWICDKAGSAEGGIGCIEIQCGNGRQDDGEQCDEGGNTDGCKYCQKAPGYNCKGFGPNTCYKINYSDGKIETGYEDCDDGNDKSGDGCYRGEVEKGWICHGTPSVCVAKACGDGIVAGDEECDDGNTKTADGCNNYCEVETSYKCTTNASGKSVCAKGKCGNGVVEKGEICDDGDTDDKNGCSNACTLNVGYQCPAAGGACKEMLCGNGSIKPDAGYVGYEQCDDKNTKAGDGCSATCTLEDHYYCKNDACTSVSSGACGDGIVGGNEECDDGNNKGADGCSPTCQIEAAFYCKNTAYNDRNSTCTTRCGDGLTMWMISGSAKEECDDGNLINGDGCSSDCKVEDGWQCTEFKPGNYPDHIEVPVTYRDFRGRDTKGSGEGYQTSEWINDLKADTTCDRKIVEGTSAGSTTASWLVSQSKTNMKDASKYANGVKFLMTGVGHPDFQGFSGNVCQGIAKDTLAADGKPEFSGVSLSSTCVVDNNSGTSNSFLKEDGSDAIGSTNRKLQYGHHILCGASFNTWFRTDTRINKQIDSKLYLKRDGGASSNTYVFDSDNPPAAARGAGGQSFVAKYFSPIDGDGVGFEDTRSSGTGASRDVNANFTTEIHTFFQYKGGEELTFSGDDDVWVYINGKLFVDLGGMHARQEMTNVLKSQTCANGQKCDPNYDIYEGGIYDIHMFQAEREYTGSNFRLTLDGFLNTGAATCKAVCGDGIVSLGEECDYDTGVYGRNDYEILGCEYPGTANECHLTKKDGKHAVCGNGRIEEGEACDTGYRCLGSSSPACDGITYVADPDCNDCKYTNCGNGRIDGNEQCDGRVFTAEAKALANCTDATCQCSDACRVIYCGDGIVNNGEECDDGNANNDDSCTTHCKAPYCGDGIKSVALGEACDDGIDNGTYGHCLFDCSAKGPRCGDGKVQVGYEECDLGSANSETAYNGCRPDCHYGLRCGDGITTAPYEACDDGELNGTSGSSCMEDCTFRPIY